MLHERSFLTSIALSFLFTSLIFFSLRSEVLAGQLTLNWGDNSSSEDGFKIERRSASSATFAQIATVGANVTFYTDAGLSNGASYCYRVQAFNSAGNSGYSNEQCGTVVAAVAVTISANPQSVSFTGTVGGSVPPPQSITVTVSNGANFTTYDQSIFYDAGPCWNGTSPLPSCPSGSQMRPTLRDDFWATVVPGTYLAPLTISSPGAQDLVIPVTLTLTASTASNVLTVSKSGTGSGTVTSSPAGINCGATCAGTYTNGTSVVLTATAASGSTFAGWTGNSDCTDGSVTMNANKSCTANFAASQAVLSVTKVGSGTVTSTSSGINCGTVCSAVYPLGTSVGLQATPSAGYVFAGWSGLCQGAAGCIILLSSSSTVTATFVPVVTTNATDKIGVYRPSTGQWLLDLNGNGVLDNCSTDLCVQTFANANGVPVVGEWTAAGVTQLGFFVPDTAQWQLDANANENWDGCEVDICLAKFGEDSDIPVSGRWSVRGNDRIGVFRPSTGRWYLDINGNGKTINCNFDRCAYLNIYQPGDLPVTGDWNGDGITDLGLFRPRTGEWFLNYYGYRTWNGCEKDRCINAFGTAADLPVSGDWDGTGASKIGVFRPSTGEWFLDLNGNGQWDGCGVDVCLTHFGQSGDYPIVGKW